MFVRKNVKKILVAKENILEPGAELGALQNLAQSGAVFLKSQSIARREDGNEKVGATRFVQ